MPHLSLRVLGAFTLTLDNKPINAFKSDKGRALLTYLAAEADRAHRRERLAGLLWPDFANRMALARLSDTLSNLRQIIGDRATESSSTQRAPYLIVTPSTAQFNLESDHTIDLRDFIEKTRRLSPGFSAPAASELPVYEAGVATYRGPFLEGFSLKDSPDFEEWALLKREQVAQRMAGVLRRLATLYAAIDDYEAAQRHGQHLIQLEPLDEENYRILMRVLMTSGNRSAALAVYENCRVALAREFKVEPDPETVALRDAIRAGRFAPGAPPAAEATTGIGNKISRAYTHNKLHSDAEPAPAVVPDPRPPLVARERELDRLGRFLDQARGGQGRVAFVTGEAGAGKSALMEAFARRAMADDPELVVARGTCNAYVGIGDPYLPFRDILAALGGDPEARRRNAIGPDHAQRLAAAWPDCAQALIEHGLDLLGLFLPAAPLLARLEALAREGGAAGDNAARLADLARRRGTGGAAPAAHFEQFAQVLRSIAARRPLLLLINDLEWADGGSISLLFHLGRRLSNSRVLFLGSYRSDDMELGRDGGRHPLEGVVNELEREFGDLRVPLPAAPGRPFVDALLDSEPNALPEDFRAALTCRTGGHPLFTVEMLRGLQERGDLIRDAQGKWRPGPKLDWDQLPSRIEAVLAERVGRLPGQQLALLEVASVEGEEFTMEVAAGVLGLGEEAVARWLNGPLRRLRLVVPTGLPHVGSRRLSRYRFTHYVLRQFLYSRLDPFERLRLHEAVGRRLEAAYGEDAPEPAVQLAWHFDQAGLADKAIDYLLRAGQHAMRLSAYHEAIRHFERGLALLATLPPSAERAGRELDLRLPLSSALIVTRGWAAPERLAAVPDPAFDVGQGNASGQTVRVLVLRASVLQAQGQLAQALRVSEEALTMARALDDRQGRMLAHGGIGITHYLGGSWRAAHAHLEDALSLYSRAEDRPLLAAIGADPESYMHGLLATALWTLGLSDQARASAARSRELAEGLGQQLNLATVVGHLLVLRALARFEGDFEGDCEYLLRVGREQDWPEIQNIGRVLQGWWLGGQGQVEAGIQQMKAAFASWPAVGKVALLPIATALYADRCLTHGLVMEGITAVEEMLALCRQGIGRLVEPELHRLRGAFLCGSAPGEAESSFLRAIEVAREQGAAAFELRAAISLARHWRLRGQSAEARELLAGIYSRFSEGFDTPDLREAAGLLAELDRKADAAQV